MSSTRRKLLLLLGVIVFLCHSSRCQAQPLRSSVVRGPSALIVLIGGMDSDPTVAQIQRTAKRHEGNSGMYRLLGDLKHEQIVVQYFNWNGTEAGKIQTNPIPGSKPIIETIRGHVQSHPRSRVIVVGNSWGGHTAWQLCHEMLEAPAPVAIDCVVFLDPSSAGRAGKSRPQQLPINIKQAVNYHTRNLFGWRTWPDEERIENIDLGDRKHGFLVDGGPAYDSAFNFAAHVAAEWDERLHADIRKRILALALESEVP